MSDKHGPEGPQVSIKFKFTGVEKKFTGVENKLRSLTAEVGVKLLRVGFAGKPTLISS
jgi:hypothetical protein